MTDAQTARHWQDWNRVAVANGWRMRKGRLVALEGEGEGAHASTRGACACIFLGNSILMIP
jgi:hypothetical protein